MKKSMNKLLLLGALMAVMANDNSVSMPQRREEFETGLSHKKKHKLFGRDQAMHNYVINGVTIRATSKKVAKKIYQRMKGNQQ